MENTQSELQCIRLAIEKQNEIVQGMLNVMKKPENRFIRVLRILLLVVGVLGVTSIINTVRNWIIGG